MKNRQITKTLHTALVV